MPIERFFHPDFFQEKQEIILEGQEFHHLRVMRLKQGEQIELVNGKRELAQARLTALHKESASLEILTIERSQEKKPYLILAQAMPLFNRLEFIIEKGTELGASAFWLFPGHQSEKTNLSSNQSERLKSLSISALKQCGRLDLPPILFKPPLKEWERAEGTLYFGDTHPEAPNWQIADNPLQAPLIFFIGPEKGFHSQEVSLLEQWGAQGVKIHSNILRVDTAALTALVLLSTLS